MGEWGLDRLVGAERWLGRWFDQLLVGAAGLALVAMALAAVGQLRRPWLLGLAFALSLVALWRGRGATWPRLSLSWADSPLAPAALVFLYFGLAAFLPPFRHDDLTYHLTLPKLYLEAGELVARPDLLFANMPHLTEVLYTWPLALGGLSAPAVLVLGFSALVLIRLWQQVHRWAGRWAAALLVLVVLSGRNVQWHLGPAHIEPVLGAFVLGAVLLVARWHERGVRPGEAVLLGVYLGFVAASKYTMWPLVALVAGVAAWVAGRRQRDGRATLAVTMRMSLVGVLFVVPWLAKSYRITGNPLYPNLYQWLGGREWSQVQAFQLGRALEAWGGGIDPTLGDRLATLWRLPLRDDFYSCPSFSIVLMLLVLGSVVVGFRDRSETRWLVGVALAGWALWALGPTNGRFLLPWVPILALAATPVLAAGRRVPWALPTLFAGTLLLGGYQLVAQSPPAEFRGSEFLDYPDPILSSHPTWELCEALEAMTPADGRVLALWENRLLCLDRPVEVDAVYQAPRALALLRQLDDPSRFAAAAARRGVTHVVIHAGHMVDYVEARYPWPSTDPEIYPRRQFERDVELLAAFVRDELELIEQLGPWGIFRLRRHRP